jgi:hypothetical protein
MECQGCQGRDATYLIGILRLVAALKTLHEVIEKCPDGMWTDPADCSAPF